MAKQDYSQYQQDVISKYYKNLDAIMLQKLSEMVTDIYLADSPAKADKLWDRVHKSMMKLEIPQQIIEHIMKKRSVEILAKNIQDWLGAKENK
jgi:hypothetical protein